MKALEKPLVRNYILTPSHIPAMVYIHFTTDLTSHVCSYIWKGLGTDYIVVWLPKKQSQMYLVSSITPGSYLILVVHIKCLPLFYILVRKYLNLSDSYLNAATVLQLNVPSLL